MTTTRWIGAGLLALALAACGKEEAPPPPEMPVLVVHPQASAGALEEAFPGEVRARQESPLSFRVGGNVLRRLVDAGDKVHAGQVLAELDVADYQLQANASRAQLAAAEADLVRARDDLARYRTLADQQLVSRSSLDTQTAAYKAAQGQVDAARANLDVNRNQARYAQLVAPADGVIASREIEAGQVVSAGQAAFTLAADGGREVVIALPENGIRRFKVGQDVQVELWSAQGKRWPGTLREIAPSADAQTRTYAARVNLADEALQAVDLGQSARVYVAGTGQGLSLPLAAVQQGRASERGAAAGTQAGKPADAGASVWVVDPADSTLKARAVQVGAYGSTSVPVLAGVQADEWVVAAGGHLLREGQKVRPVDRQGKPVLAAAAQGKSAPAAAKGE